MRMNCWRHDVNGLVLRFVPGGADLLFVHLVCEHGTAIPCIPLSVSRNDNVKDKKSIIKDFAKAIIHTITYHSES